MDNPTFSIPESLSQSIYRYLENMIISGKLSPGDRLVPDEIADSLKVSKSPVREALMRLEKEGLVANLPRIGFFVTDINIDDIEEIYPIRMALLSLAVKTILECGYETDFMDSVDGYIKEMSQYVKNGDVDGYSAVNIKLYDCYCTYCPNSRLRAMINQVAKQVIRFRLLGIKQPGRLERSFELNNALVKAIKDKAIDTAGELTAKIVYEGLIALRKVLKKQ